MTGEARWLGRRVEMQAMRSDGTTFPAELAVCEVKLPERRMLATYLRDLTPRKEAEAEIRRQRDALHERMRSLLPSVRCSPASRTS